MSKDIKMKKNINNLSRGMKASIAFFIANVITAGIGYITTPFFTRMLSAEEFGYVNKYLSWEKLFGIIAMFCLSYGVFNNGMSDYPDKRNEYSYSMLCLSNIITCIFAIILFSTYSFTKNIIGLNIPLLLLMVSVFLFQPAYRFWTVRQRFEYKYKLTVLWTIICAFLSPVVALLCIKFIDGNKAYSRIFGAELCLVAIYICFFIYLGNTARWKCNKEFWKPAIKFNLPLIPHYLSTYILSSSDKIMISNICGDTATAYYSIAYSVASVGTIVWSAANASLVPFTYEKCKTKEYKIISDVVMPILVLYGVVCLLVILLAPEIVFFLGSDEYSESIYAIPPVIGGIFFQVQYYMYANVLYYYKKPRYVMFASVTAMLLNIILNIIFIEKYGYIAAGYTTLLCYLLQAFIDYLAMRKVVGQSVYNMRFVILFSVLVIGISLISGVFYKYQILRFALLTITLVLSFIFRKRIVSIIKLIKQK